MKTLTKGLIAILISTLSYTVQANEIPDRYAWVEFSGSLYGRGVGMKVTPRESNSIYAFGLFKHFDDHGLDFSNSISGSRSASQTNGEITEVSGMRIWHGAKSAAFADFGVGAGFIHGTWEADCRMVGNEINQFEVCEEGNISAPALVMEVSVAIGNFIGFGFFARGVLAEEVSSAMVGVRIPIGRFN